MKICVACILFLAFGLISAGSSTAADKQSTVTQTTPTTPAATHTTTKSPATTPSATSPVEPTTGPITTEPQSDKTTAQPTTVPATTAATTAAPVKEPVNNYTVYNKDKKPCLLAKFKGHFSNGKKTWYIGPDAAVSNDSSDCGNLFVTFGKKTFHIKFNKTAKSDKSSSFYITAVFATLSLNGSSIEINATDLDIAKASNGSSYMCLAGIDITMSKNITFKMAEVQLQPYWIGTEGKFATAQKCHSDLSPLVPIIVGAVLAGLVVIVVVAYFIGRNRNRVGYEEI